MATIAKIEIDGFKAFPKSFTLDLKNGKNLLLYGENGSGKSSLYYALHVMLQSVFKDDKGAKYFKPGDVNGDEFITNNEHLINIFRFDEAKVNTYTPHIRITFDDGKVWRLDNSGLLSENGGNESAIRMLNKDSAFINHSYISRFYAARNSEEINLWNVFNKDILPFHIPAGETQFLADLYEDIVRDCKDGMSMRNKRLQTRIDKFNILLSDSINRINTKVNDIYNNNLKHEGDKNIEIKLIYYSDNDPDNKLKEHFYLYYGNIRHNKTIGRTDLYPPKIGIEIKEDGSPINKPQSHFNEAKLTAIALSIRFACMTSNAIAPGAFLALDDMLISLDMSNRMKVIKYLLNQVAPTYKLYIFTHDKLLFNSFRKKIILNKQQDDWLWGGIYMHDRDNSIDFNPCIPYPIFIEEKNALLEAREYYIEHDYPACGQRLRKWCEEILNQLYPSALLKFVDPGTGKTIDTNLNDRINLLSQYCEKESIDYAEFKDLKIYKDNVLNTVSHYDSHSPIYGNEILSIMRILSKLEQIATGQKEIVVNRKLGIELIAKNGRPITICINIRNSKIKTIEYNGNRKISYYTKCMVYKIIDNRNNIDIDPEISYDSIYDAYKYYCEQYGADSTINLLDVLMDHGVFLKDKI